MLYAFCIVAPFARLERSMWSRERYKEIKRALFVLLNEVACGISKSICHVSRFWGRRAIDLQDSIAMWFSIGVIASRTLKESEKVVVPTAIGMEFNWIA